jgi:hypothetical protein
MSSIKKTTSELQAKQGALDKLNNEKNKLTQSLNELQKKRSVATRDLAAGDESQQEIIFNLEGQIAPILLRLEGIETLISEANEKVQTATKFLEEAKADYARGLAAFIAEREAQELEKLKAGLPARKQRLFDLYAQFCEELGRFQVDQFYSADGQQIREVLDITAGHVGENLRAALQARRLRPLMERGAIIDISAWSHYPMDPENAGIFPGIGPVHATAIAKVVRSKRIAGFEKEFESKHRD